MVGKGKWVSAKPVKSQRVVGERGNKKACLSVVVDLCARARVYVGVAPLALACALV